MSGTPPTRLPLPSRVNVPLHVRKVSTEPRPRPLAQSEPSKSVAALPGSGDTLRVAQQHGDASGLARPPRRQGSSRRTDAGRRARRPVGTGVEAAAVCSGPVNQAHGLLLHPTALDRDVVASVDGVGGCGGVAVVLVGGGGPGPTRARAPAPSMATPAASRPNDDGSTASPPQGGERREPPPRGPPVQS